MPPETRGGRPRRWVLENVDPAECAAVLVIRDRDATLKRWQTTALCDLLKDPELEALFGPLRKTCDVLWAKLLKEEPGLPGKPELFRARQAAWGLVVEATGESRGVTPNASVASPDPRKEK